MLEERRYFKYVSVSKNLNATASYLWKRRNLNFFPDVSLGVDVRKFDTVAIGLWDILRRKWC